MLNQEAMQILSNNILLCTVLKFVRQLTNMKKIQILFCKVIDEVPLVQFRLVSH